MRAIAEAAALRIKAGGEPKVEIMVPLVGSVMELHLIRDETDGIVHEVAEREGVDLHIPVGTMIELPRAALTAGRIAEAAEFFSFGTNDLTQTTWGFSRDDVEAAFFAAYLEKGVFTVSPFETLDAHGVGRLVQIVGGRGPGGAPGPQGRGLRRARRRPRVGALLPQRRARLRVLLAVPGPGGAARGGARGDLLARHRTADRPADDVGRRFAVRRRPEVWATLVR